MSVTVTMEYEFNQSKINQKIYFYKDTKRIDFETVVDWKEHQHLMKAHFPFDVHTDEATFEIQFGNVKRKVHSNTSWEEARPSSPFPILAYNGMFNLYASLTVSEFQLPLCG